ncbi:Zinc metalloproteinase-disintegrin-like MTP9 [Halotydeus destructor]|nr:Zinc metalloproteinase-disintegrin-like MTP9 [Halotydeus destructor]
MTSFLIFCVALFIINSVISKDIYQDYPHEVIEPDIQCDDEDCHRIKLKFAAIKQHFEFSLILNSYLFSKEYEEEIKQTFRSNEVNTNCYYVSENEDDFAALEICDGHVTGILEHGKHGLHIEIHYDDETGEHNCYTKLPVVRATRRLLTPPGAFGELTPETDGRSQGEPVVELMFVNDHELLTKYFGGDKETLIKMNQRLANYANALYSKVGIKVVLVGTEVWEDKELIGRQKPGPVDGQETDEIEVHLDKFGRLAYKNYKEKHYDVIHLIMGYTYGNVKQPGFTLGIAYTKTVCTPRNTGIFHFSGDGKQPLSMKQLAQTITHELGHNLGQGHVSVGDPKCPCDGPRGRCIMNPYSSDSEEWTQCDADTFNQVATSVQGRCLHLHAGDYSNLTATISHDETFPDETPAQNGATGALWASGLLSSCLLILMLFY